MIWMFQRELHRFFPPAELCFVCAGCFYCFYCTSFFFFFSLDSLFWVGLFWIQTDQISPVCTQSKMKD